MTDEGSTHFCPHGSTWTACPLCEKEELAQGLNRLRGQTRASPDYKAFGKAVAEILRDEATDSAIPKRKHLGHLTKHEGLILDAARSFGIDLTRSEP